MKLPEPAAWRLEDKEASADHGKPIYVYYDMSHVRPGHKDPGSVFAKIAAVSPLEPMFTEAQVRQLMGESRTEVAQPEKQNTELNAKLAAPGVAERQAVRDAVLAEREECAMVAESGFKYALSGYEIADKIRARGAA